MILEHLHLDMSRLEKLRRRGEKLTARCPACAAAEGDRRGEHLVLLPGGRFACAAFPGDSGHRREIFALIGIRGERQRDPDRDRRWRRTRQEELRKLEEQKTLAEIVRQNRPAIAARHQWDDCDVFDSSPQRIDSHVVEFDARHFLSSLFHPDDVIWCGKVHESGERFARNWRTCAEWAARTESPRGGPMVSPGTWKVGTTSRAAANVLTAPYVVADFDELDGRKPESAIEIADHVASSLALVRWFREAMGWTLAAIVFTGGKSIHAWFHSPPAQVLQSLRGTAKAFGIDAGLIGHPEHPCRLPGHRHEKTGQLSRVLWLQCGME
jgi:hypothetical protein